MDDDFDVDNMDFELPQDLVTSSATTSFSPAPLPSANPFAGLLGPESIPSHLNQLYQPEPLTAEQEAESKK